VNGTERVITTLEDLAPNKILVELKNDMVKISRLPKYFRSAEVIAPWSLWREAKSRFLKSHSHPYREGSIYNSYESSWHRD